MNNQKINQTSDIVIEVIQIFVELDLSNIIRELFNNLINDYDSESKSLMDKRKSLTNELILHTIYDKTKEDGIIK